MEYNFYETLVSIMQERGIKKTDIIRDLNLGKNSFSFWQKNGNMPNGDTLKRLVDYLNISLDTLAGNSDERSPGIKKDPPGNAGGLSERAIEFLRLFDSLPEDRQDAVIAAARAFQTKERSLLRQKDHPEDRQG